MFKGNGRGALFKISDNKIRLHVSSEFTKAGRVGLGRLLQTTKPTSMRASYEGSASPFICSSVKAFHVTDCCHSVETTDRKQQLIDHLQLGQTNIWINIAACLCVCPSLCMPLFFSLLSLSLSLITAFCSRLSQSVCLYFSL